MPEGPGENLGGGLTPSTAGHLVPLCPQTHSGLGTAEQQGQAGGGVQGWKTQERSISATERLILIPPEWCLIIQPALSSIVSAAPG